MWRPFDNAATIGQLGSERGVIIRDEEHDAGARITLERGCSNAPFSVTCGIYGCFFHTRFLGMEAETEFQVMRDELERILRIIPRVDDVEADAKMTAACEAISNFVLRFP